MARVKRGVTSHARHKKVLEEAKGYRGRRKNTIKVARQAVEKAGTTDYVKVIKALEENEFDNVLGKIGFNEKGDVTGVANFVFYEYGEETYTQK